MSRPITAEELLKLAIFHRDKGEAVKATFYEVEEEQLQAEMNRD